VITDFSTARSASGRRHRSFSLRLSVWDKDRSSWLVIMVCSKCPITRDAYYNVALTFETSGRYSFQSKLLMYVDAGFAPSIGILDRWRGPSCVLALADSWWWVTWST